MAALQLLDCLGQAGGKPGTLVSNAAQLWRQLGFGPVRVKGQLERKCLSTVDTVLSEPDATEQTKWQIHNERIVDATRRLRLSIASVELPDGHRFEQYVLRMPKAAMVAVLDDEDRVLMVWRHRFIIDKWVWELPGGYVDDDEDPGLAAAREVEEETGWRPNGVAFLGSFQPMIGSADAENLLYIAHGADYIGDQTDINEAVRIEWIPLASVRELMASGEIVGGASQIALLHVLAHQRS